MLAHQNKVNGNTLSPKFEFCDSQEMWIKCGSNLPDGIASRRKLQIYGLQSYVKLKFSHSSNANMVRVRL